MGMRIAPQRVGFAMLVFGAAGLLASILFTSSVLAFVGLGLLLWGAVMLYVRQSDYVPTATLDASISPYPDTLNSMVQALDGRGRAVYLPPKYFENPEDTRVFIPEQEGGNWPTPEQILENKDQLLFRDPPGILLTPPGAELARLFEKTLETSFTRVNLEYLRTHLPRLLTEDLEIVTTLEIRTSVQTSPQQPKSLPIGASGERINVVVTSFHPSIFTQVFHQPRSPVLGNPLTSAIACAIAKATGRPTIITGQESAKDGKTLRAEYCLLEESTQK